MENSDYTQKQQLNINLDKIQDTGLRGVRRAYVFMGFGINSANDPNFTNFHLPVESCYRLLPETVTEKQLAEFKEAYSHWSISCALRELIENYEVFLDEMFFAVCAIQKKEEFTLEDIKSKAKNFHRKNFPEKLKTLKEYNVETAFIESILSIKKARNCIGHRLNKVQTLDFNQDDKMIVTWRGYDVFAQTESGNKIDIMQQGKFVNQDGIPIEEPADLMMKVCDRSKTFSLGEVVSFGSAELHEMGMMFIHSIQQMTASVLTLAKAAGIHHESPFLE